MTNRAQWDERLRYLRHRDCSLHARRLTRGLQRVLEGERVDHRREHAHVVGTGAVHTPVLAAHASPDVAAADHDGDLDAELATGGGNLVGDPLDDRGVDAESAAHVGEGLTRELQHHSPVPAQVCPTLSHVLASAFAEPGSGLADLDAGEATHRGNRSEARHQLPDGRLRLLDEALLDENVVLVEAAQPALDDLWDRVLGLAL